MNKYESLWKWIQENGTDSFKLTFDEIEKIAGLPIDHSFLNCKKELLNYGYKVGKISLKGKTVDFEKVQRMHHEIYLSDARKVAPEKLKTVMRHPIRKG